MEDEEVKAIEEEFESLVSQLRTDWHGIPNPMTEAGLSVLKVDLESRMQLAKLRARIGAESTTEDGPPSEEKVTSETKAPQSKANTSDKAQELTAAQKAMGDRILKMTGKKGHGASKSKDEKKRKKDKKKDKKKKKREDK